MKVGYHLLFAVIKLISSKGFSENREKERGDDLLLVRSFSRNAALPEVYKKGIDGENGFGYDPIFYYPPLKKTSAVMTMEEKNKVSHRAKALKALYDYLEEAHK